MKFKHTPREKPTNGQLKSKTKFALLPVLIDGYWVWLEKYELVSKKTI